MGLRRELKQQQQQQLLLLLLCLLLLRALAFVSLVSGFSCMQQRTNKLCLGLLGFRVEGLGFRV